MGKQLPLSMLQMLSDANSGHHSWKLKDLNIDYDYLINLKDKTISIKGEANYSKSLENSKYLSETVLLRIKKCLFNLVFTDSDRKIIGIEEIFVKPDSFYYEPFSFEGTVPYDASYYYMSIFYKYYARGNW